MKNGNGLGTITKLKGKRRKSWAVRVSCEEDGKVKRKYIGYAETKKEAEKLRLEYIKNPTVFSGKTLGEITKLWFRTYYKDSISKNTLKQIKVRLNKIEPLNDYKLTDLKPYFLQNYFDELEVSYNYKNSIKSLLNMIFDFALKNDFIQNNRIKFIELGKKEVVIERRIFTEEEISKLWNNLNIKSVSHILILIYTGMRISELLNLKNENIDLENKSINIIDSKTKNGIRTIPIANKIFELVKKDFNWEQQYFLETRNKRTLNYSQFKRNFKRVLKNLSIEKHTIHDTRHTFATLLNNADANSTSIVRLVGHSDFSITEKVYTHKDTEELRKAVELIQ